MKTRQQTRENRDELRNTLLRNFRSGALRPGDALPTVRDLANRHNLSPATTQRVLRGLADEGVIQLRQGAGAFVGRLPEQENAAFAVIFGDDFSDPDYAYLRTVRDGFETEIARRGATALPLTPQTRGLQEVLDAAGANELAMGGSFLFGSTNAKHNSRALQISAALPGPQVVHADNAKPHMKIKGDSIHFDDCGGARQAVRHLWQRGHREIAFLALHNAQTPLHQFIWSRRREAGFCEAATELDLRPHVFHPQKVASQSADDQHALGADAARQLLPLLRKGTVSAVICVNRGVLEGLGEVARQNRLPEARWPALVSFDDAARDDHLLSVLRLPWDELGRAAAQALWQRTFGSAEQKTAPAREIAVPMRLVARLSCFDRSRSFTRTSHFVSA